MAADPEPAPGRPSPVRRARTESVWASCRLSSLSVRAAARCAARLDRSGSRGRTERRKVDAVRGAGGGANGKRRRRSELIVLDPGHQSVDDAHRAVEIGIEQYERESTVAAGRQNVGLS